MTMFELQFPVRDIAKHAARYSYEDDAVQRAMGQAARERGWYTRPAFVEVCRWKTPRSGPLVVENSAADIKSATRTALRRDCDERERMRVLQELRGVAWATASVLLHLAYPELYPIWDVRALQALGVRGRFTPSYTRWEAYVDYYRRLVERSGLDGRGVDKGLWQWSVDHGGPLT